MLDQKTGVPKSGRHLLSAGSSANSPRQQRLMLMALVLLLISLAFVLYRDRDFWFPDTQEADARPLSPPEARDTPPAASAAAPTAAPATAPSPRKKPRVHEAVRRDRQVSNDPPSAGPAVTTIRTVLPPLEVEVVAGDAHRTVRPGSNAVHVDLPNAPSRQDSAPVRDVETVARVITPAAERTNVSTDAAATLVTRSVQPQYPMLARQMRVQGSVILQALIGRDGLIQDLRVLSGPPILANAAREAVRQWHFKPHYVGEQPVETRASITVNFTISTN